MKRSNTRVYASGGMPGPLSMRIENRQRRAHLVRGMGNEALLRERVVGNAPLVLVERAGNRLQFVLPAVGVERRKVGGRARKHIAGQP
ncbi:hypothetical protein OWR21_04940 [Ralstonia sp. 1B3]